jgi:hypothetical protein
VDRDVAESGLLVHRGESIADGRQLLDALAAYEARRAAAAAELSQARRERMLALRERRR